MENLPRWRKGYPRGKASSSCLRTNRGCQFEWTPAVGLKVSGQFIPGGGTVNEGGAQANLFLRPDMSVTASVQYEQWNFPVLAARAHTNVTSAVQLTFWLWRRVR